MKIFVRDVLYLFLVLIGINILLYFIEDYIPNRIIYLLFCVLGGYWGVPILQHIFGEATTESDFSDTLKTVHIFAIIGVIASLIFGYYNWRLNYGTKINEQAEKHDEWREEMNTLAKANKNALPLIDIKNGCNKKISIAISYLDLNKNWTTIGWAILKEDFIGNSKVYTFNDEVYIYADLQMDWWGWEMQICYSNGVDTERFEKLPVVNQRFIYQPGREIYGYRKRNRKFYRLIANSEGNYSVEINCNCSFR